MQRVSQGRIWARVHHKVVENFGSEADVQSLYYRRWYVLPKFATHGRSAKWILTELCPRCFENEPDFRPMHTKLESLLSKSLTTLEVMTYYLVVHTGPAETVWRSATVREVAVQTRARMHHKVGLVGLVVRRPPRERKVPGSNPACAGIFSGSSHTCDLNIGTPVATLPGACRYRVSAGTGWPGVSILWLGEMESLVCNFYFSVAARKIVWAGPSLRYTRMLLGR